MCGRLKDSATEGGVVAIADNEKISKVEKDGVDSRLA
jgi:hypothetical protein